jgi:hypothetical protein
MASTRIDVQKIGVTLSDPDVTIEPGSVRQLLVTLVNGQDAPDRLSIEIEGVDVEWYSMPEAAFYVQPGAEVTARINFRVVRESGNLAGVYPFLVRVQAMETGEIGAAQATLVIKPFHSLQLEMTPKRAVATYFGRYNDFEVTVANLGNAEETIELFANDPEDGVAYEFDAERLTLKPGQTRTVLLATCPKLSSILGGMRLYGFTVTARSVTDAYVSAGAHAQLEKRPLISPLLGIFLLLIGLVIGGWFATRPTPPQPIVLGAFDADQKHVHFGDQVKLTWNVSPANSQIVISYHVAGSKTEIFDPGQQRTAIGSVEVTPQLPQTIYTLTVTSGKRSRSRQLPIDVIPPPVTPHPVLRNFTATPATIHAGDSVMLSWESKNAKELILDPGSTTMDAFEQTRQITPTTDTEYTLRALPLADNYEPATRSVKVHVVAKDVCTAVIDRFAASRGNVYIGDTVKLVWKTRLAMSARIDSDHGSIGAVATAGSIDEVVNDPTTFTLTVLDSAGNRTTKSVTITPRPRPVPVQVPPPDTGAQTAPPDTTTPPTTPPNNGQ